MSEKLSFILSVHTNKNFKANKYNAISHVYSQGNYGFSCKNRNSYYPRGRESYKLTALRLTSFPPIIVNLTTHMILFGDDIKSINVSPLGKCPVPSVLPNGTYRNMIGQWFNTI